MRTVLLSVLIAVLAISLLSLAGCPKSEAVVPDDAVVSPPGPPSPEGEKSSELSIDIPEGKPGEKPPGATAAGPDGGPRRVDRPQGSRRGGRRPAAGWVVETSGGDGPRKVRLVMESAGPAVTLRISSPRLTRTPTESSPRTNCRSASASA